MYKQTANLTISANLSKTDMTILDIILLLCFVPAVVAGISKGFVSQVVQIAALILGAWAAFHFSSVICDWLSQYLTMDETMLKIVAFILVIIVITLILNLLGNMLTHLLHALTLGWFNRILGALFGILKVGVILGLLIMVFEGLNSSMDLVDRSPLDGSKVYTALRELTETVFPYLKGLVAGISE